MRVVWAGRAGRAVDGGGDHARSHFRINIDARTLSGHSQDTPGVRFLFITSEDNHNSWNGKPARYSALDLSVALRNRDRIRLQWQEYLF